MSQYLRFSSYVLFLFCLFCVLLSCLCICVLCVLYVCFCSGFTTDARLCCSAGTLMKHALLKY